MVRRFLRWDRIAVELGASDRIVQYRAGWRRMAETWPGISPRLEAMKQSKAAASAASAEIVSAFTEEMVGAAVEQQEATEQADETLGGAYELARDRLRSPRQRSIELQERRSQQRAELREKHEAEQEGAGKQKAKEKAPVLTAKGRARQLAEATKGLASDELATIIASLEDRYESALDREANETAAAAGQAAADYSADDADVGHADELTGLE